MKMTTDAFKTQSNLTPVAVMSCHLWGFGGVVVRPLTFHL